LEQPRPRTTHTVPSYKKNKKQKKLHVYERELPVWTAEQNTGTNCWSAVCRAVDVAFNYRLLLYNEIKSNLYNIIIIII
jgi:hypothetical protein